MAVKEGIKKDVIGVRPLQGVEGLGDRDHGGDEERFMENERVNGCKDYFSSMGCLYAS